MVLRRSRPPFGSTKGPVAFQVLSDLHLEVSGEYDSVEIPVRSKYLILAGDVGRLADYKEYLEFLQKQTRNFQTVFLVLGNHEFHDLSFESTLEKARDLEQEPCLNGRLVLLHQRRFDVPESSITIVGSALWSHIPDEAKDNVRSRSKDFKRIEDWTVEKHNAAHESDLIWLREEVHSIHQENQNRHSDERSIVVVTHHAPSLHKTSKPEYANSPWSSSFATDLLSQQWDGVKAWVFGHTHYSTRFKDNGILVVSNQLGYKPLSETGPNQFDPAMVICI
ncbi:calcineurin-like phosphoesterase [Penicillium argentinense]|uniref:Calcineurin-like phosphoesterase n=1 Tax=Penicillium argentinense TaxID=1131581 RepID=A0A9W9FGJ4_9EURO|nr:calcineurin-like phosphoesterase [Penicillium argentinense]KAJ5099756.1 calcineurin-like phosphoesterase [Penicillium argentinense]